MLVVELLLCTGDLSTTLVLFVCTTTIYFLETLWTHYVRVSIELSVAHKLIARLLLLVWGTDDDKNLTLGVVLLQLPLTGRRKNMNGFLIFGPVRPEELRFYL